MLCYLTKPARDDVFFAMQNAPTVRLISDRRMNFRSILFYKFLQYCFHNHSSHSTSTTRTPQIESSNDGTFTRAKTTLPNASRNPRDPDDSAFPRSSEDL